MASPPVRMRKGFDRSLTKALETTRRTLFIDYANVPPDSSRVFLIADHASDKELRSTSALPMMPAEAVFSDVLARMMPSEIDKAMDYAIQLVLSKQDARTPEFLRFHSQLHGDEMIPEEQMMQQNVRKKKKS